MPYNKFDDAYDNGYSVTVGDFAAVVDDDNKNQNLLIWLAAFAFTLLQNDSILKQTQIPLTLWRNLLTPDDYKCHNHNWIIPNHFYHKANKISSLL